MTATQAARLRVLADILSTVAGAPVEITIRGDASFTWSLAERNEAAAAKLEAYAKEQPAGCNVATVHDDEAGSFVYVDFNA